jgi:hypothetical protein
VRDFRGAWLAACIKAGLAEQIEVGQRRTEIRYTNGKRFEFRMTFAERPWEPHSIGRGPRYSEENGRA